MKLKKTLKMQKGGLLNINWNCSKEKCEFDDEKKSIDFYDKIYDQTNLFFEKINLENIEKIDSIDFNRDLYADKYEEFVFSSENKKCASCLEYYKQNRDEELLNLQKLFLSIKLEFYVDYLYRNFNNIIIFLPLIDIFYNSISSKLSSKNEKNTNKKEKFKELYLNLRNRKNITFKDIDYLLEIFFHILNLQVLTTNVISFITLINNMLQLFREILKQKTLSLSLLLSKININKLIIEKLTEIVDINKYLNIESLKEFLGEEIFEELSLLIKDYNENFSINDKIIDIQKYLKLKIDIFMSKFSFLNFGILPKLLNINQFNTSTAGGGTGVKPSIKKRASQLYSSIKLIKKSIATKLSPSKYQKLHSTNEDTNIFNSRVTWNNFNSFLKKDKRQHTIYDVINNVNNDYHILNLILGSVSINIDSDKKSINLIKYFNELFYKPFFGKMCFHKMIEYNDDNQNNERQLIQDNENNKNNKNSKPNKPNKPFKSINQDLGMKFKRKITNKMDIGVDDICRGLNEELTLSTGSLKSFDNFIGKIFNLDFKYTHTEYVKSIIMREMILTFVENIMKNNIDDFIKLQISEFILQINNPYTNTEFLSRFKSIYFHAQSFIDSFRDFYRYIGHEKKLEKKDKEIYEEIIGFIKNSFNKYVKYDDKHKDMFINYFLYYYYQLIELLDVFIKYFGKINDGNSIISKYKNANKNNLIPEHQIDKNIFINLFRYTIPISSELLEEFLQFTIISGYDGFNYLQYDGNKKFIELYITNEKYHMSLLQEQLKKNIQKKIINSRKSTIKSTSQSIGSTHKGNNTKTKKTSNTTNSQSKSIKK
jgi:hypothetical protein